MSHVFSSVDDDGDDDCDDDDDEDSTGRASQTCLDLPGRYLLLRPIRRYATGQGVVFDLSVLNKVYIV